MAYDGLELGEFRPTQMFLQLADHSTRLPKGIFVDVLIKVREFIFLVDSIALKTEVVMCTENEILVILDWPFLTTLNALISFRDGKTKLNFGNITMKLNVFNLQKQPIGYDHVERSILNWIFDFFLEEMEFDHDGELISWVYKSFCIKYKLEYDTFEFDKMW